MGGAFGGFRCREGYWKLQVLEGAHKRQAERERDRELAESWCLEGGKQEM